MNFDELLDDPVIREYLDHAEREMLPKMKQSAISIAIVTGNVDIKFMRRDRRGGPAR
jgi:hypothetical protein